MAYPTTYTSLFSVGRGPASLVSADFIFLGSALPCLSVYLHVCLSICLPLSAFVYLLICLPVFIFVCPYKPYITVRRN
jgi:hypothetical protein